MRKPCAGQNSMLTLFTLRGSRAGRINERAEMKNEDNYAWLDGLFVSWWPGSLQSNPFIHCRSSPIMCNLVVDVLGGSNLPSRFCGLNLKMTGGDKKKTLLVRNKPEN